MISNASASPFVTSADRCAAMERSCSVNFRRLDWIRDIHEQITSSLALYHWLSSFLFLAISLKKLDVHVCKGIVFVIHTYSSIVLFLSLFPPVCLWSLFLLSSVWRVRNWHASTLLHIAHTDGFHLNCVYEREDKQACCEHLFAISISSMYAHIWECLCVQLRLISALEWHLSVFFRSLSLFLGLPASCSFIFSLSLGLLLLSR